MGTRSLWWRHAPDAVDQHRSPLHLHGCCRVAHLFRCLGSPSQRNSPRPHRWWRGHEVRLAAIERRVRQAIRYRSSQPASQGGSRVVNRGGSACTCFCCRTPPSGAPAERAAWQIVLDSRDGESVNRCSLRHMVRWLRLAGAVALALATTPAKAQSPEQSTPPCSSVPTLSRSGQPAPPPCPDPPPAESGPADSLPTPSLSPSAPLIERAREAAFQFSRKLPNFICQEFMSRFTQQGRGEKVPQDVVSAEIIFEDGEESYRNVRINNRATDKHLQDIDGSWSTGEFASAMLDLFDPASKAQFR